jgi:hypothetical protein
LTQTGNTPFADAKFTLITNTLADTAFVRVEHHFTEPDAFGTPAGMVLSPNHYWSFHGVFPAGYSAEGIIQYDGRTSGFTGNNYLDNQLIVGTEDSLTLLFRPDAGTPWQICQGLTHNMGNANDKAGGFRIAQMQRGEYCLARKAGPSVVGDLQMRKSALHLYPNPAAAEVNINFSEYIQKGSLSLLNAQGKELLHQPVYESSQMMISVKGYPAGTYFIRVMNGNKTETAPLNIQP